MFLISSKSCNDAANEIEQYNIKNSSCNINFYC